jgi:putative spermidine/putrescine transport system permease protein
VALTFSALLTAFILAPLIVVMLISLSDKEYLSMPFDGASLRWYHEILAAPCHCSLSSVIGRSRTRFPVA